MRRLQDRRTGNQTDSCQPERSGKVEPVFEEFEGWLTDITSIRTFDELPVQAKTYLNRLSEVAGVELGIVSVGPEREQTIVLKKLL